MASLASGTKLSCYHQVGTFKLFPWRDKELLLHPLRQKEERDLGAGNPGSGIQRERLKIIIYMDVTTLIGK